MGRVRTGIYWEMMVEKKQSLYLSYHDMETRKRLCGQGFAPHISFQTNRTRLGLRALYCAICSHGTSSMQDTRISLAMRLQLLPH